MFKKSAAVILCIVTVLVFSSCRNNSTVNSTPETTAEATTEVNFTDKTAENNTLVNNINPDSTSPSATVPASDITTSETASAANPSEWSTAEIIDAYKKAAAKSNDSVKSEQTITLKDFSINNGQYENVLDFVMPIMSKILANNSTEKDGITGGYQNLCEADIESARAVAAGDKIAIEMTMKNQTDGPRGDALGGSVGHAITAVGDIGVVTDQINDLGIAIEISDKDTKINYTNATVRVLIDKDGKIVKGTWKYTVDIRLNNYKVGKSTVETTSIVMDNVITVNGGF